MIQDHSDHGRSKLMNWWMRSEKGFIGSFELPWSEWSLISDPDLDHPRRTHPRIHRFIWSTMIRVISDHWSWSGSSQSNAPKDSWVHLTYHNPSDLWSVILIRIIPKGCTLQSWTKALGHFCVSEAFSNSHRTNPSPHPTNNVGCMHPEFFPSFNFVYGGGRENCKKIFKKDALF